MQLGEGLERNTMCERLSMICCYRFGAVQSGNDLRIPVNDSRQHIDGNDFAGRRSPHIYRHSSCVPFCPKCSIWSS